MDDGGLPNFEFGMDVVDRPSIYSTVLLKTGAETSHTSQIISNMVRVAELVTSDAIFYFLADSD